MFSKRLFRIPHSVLIEHSPVDAKEDLAVAHRVVGRDEGVVIAREQEHVAVLNKDVCLLDVDGQRGVDEGEIPDEDIVLKVERPQRWHISIRIILGEILYGDAGLEDGGFFEDGLLEADFQFA